MKAITIDQAQARAEQAAVEATIEYQLEQAFRTIEDELFALLEQEDTRPTEALQDTTHYIW